MSTHLPGITVQHLQPGQSMCLVPAEGVPGGSRIRPDSTLPDPTITGPCQAQATFMCTGEARGECLNPLAMLPGSEVPADYVPMCQPCKDHLSDAYVAALHS